MASTRPLALELMRQLAIVAVVPIVVTIAFFIWQLFPQLKDGIIKEQQSIANLVAEQTQQRIDTAEEQVSFFLELARENPEQIDQIVPGFVQQSSFFDSLYLLNQNHLISAIGIRNANQNLSNQLYLGIDVSQSSMLETTKEQSASHWTGVFLSVVTGRLSIAYVVPLKEGKLVAELAIDRLPKLSQKLEELGILVMILDDNYQLIAHPDPEYGQRQISLSHLAIFQHPQNAKVYSDSFVLNNQRYFGTHIEMLAPAWSIIVAEQESVTTAVLFSTMRSWFVAMIIILVLALFIAKRRSKEFSERFSFLNQQANDITQGSYKPAQHPTRITEFKDLSDNLEAMADAIEKREQSLQTKELQLRNTLESTPIIAIQWYDDEGRIRYWNKASERFFGFSSEEAEGQVLGNLILEPLAASHFVQHLNMVAERKASNREFELPFQNKSGQPGQVLATLFRIPSQEGRDMYACMMTDVTQQRQAEANIRMLNMELEKRVEERTQELQAANTELKDTVDALNNTMEQLVQSEKLASLGSLVAGVAHELNTPIGNARMASSTLHDFSKEITQQLQDGSIKKSALERFLEDAMSATGITSRNLERASELISSFKQVAADQSSSLRREFYLDELVHENLVTLHPQTKKKPIDIEVQVEPDLAMNSYPGPLGQVLSNLILNAEIHAFEEGQKGHIRISAEKRGQQVSLQVADDGSGIDPALLSKVFDPFYTTKLGQGGSGLGLHIVHNIVSEVLGGQIDVHSKHGEGSTFTLIIPCEAPVSASEGKAPLQ